MDASNLPELAAGGGLLALVVSAVFRIHFADRDWRNLIDLERESRHEADERADAEAAKRVVAEAELRVALRRVDELEGSVRDLRSRLKAHRRTAVA